MSERLVLVTGAGGFVGKHLCAELRRSGYKLRAASIGPKPTDHYSRDIASVTLDSIGPDTNWDEALGGGVTDVVHLAAVAHRISGKERMADAVYNEVNHLGTQRLAESACKAQVRRFIFISSIGAVTALSDKMVDETTPCKPSTAYGRSKLAAEYAVASAFKGSDTEWCVLRPPLLYGSGSPGNMGRLLRLIKLPFPLPFASIRNRRSFLYVANLSNAIGVALQHPGAARDTFLVSDGEAVSTAELVRRIAAAAGRRPRMLPVPISLLHALGTVTGKRAAIERLTGSLVIDDSKIRTKLGWNPPFTMEEGLRECFSAEPAS